MLRACTHRLNVLAHKPFLPLIHYKASQHQLLPFQSSDLWPTWPGVQPNVTSSPRNWHSNGPPRRPLLDNTVFDNFIHILERENRTRHGSNKMVMKAKYGAIHSQIKQMILQCSLSNVLLLNEMVILSLYMYKGLWFSKEDSLPYCASKIQTF